MTDPKDIIIEYINSDDGRDMMLRNVPFRTTIELAMRLEDSDDVIQALLGGLASVSSDYVKVTGILAEHIAERATVMVIPIELVKPGGDPVN